MIRPFWWRLDYIVYWQSLRRFYFIRYYNSLLVLFKTQQILLLGSRNFTCGKSLNISCLIFFVFFPCTYGAITFENFILPSNTRAQRRFRSHPHSRSLIRISSERILDSQGCKVFSRGKQRLIRLRRLVWVFVGRTRQKIILVVAHLS